MFDGKAFGQEVVAAVKAHVDKSLAPLLARLDAVEQKLVKAVAVDEEDLGAVKSDVESIRKAIEELPAPAAAPELPDISAMVAEAVAAIPAPEPGKSVTLDDVRPLVDEAVQKAVDAIPAPRDGCGVKDLLIDRDGALVATLDDGRIKNLGPVVGKDADMDALQASVAERVAAIPKPEDGKDGFGFDDLQVIHDGARGFTFRFAKGERIKDFAFSLPVVLDCGVFKEGQTYQAGDGVTWGGSFWIAQEETKDKPDSGKGWRLAVKRGRDGKDGVLKAEKPKEPVRVG